MGKGRREMSVSLCRTALQNESPAPYDYLFEFLIDWFVMVMGDGSQRRFSLESVSASPRYISSISSSIARRSSGWKVLSVRESTRRT